MWLTGHVDPLFFMAQLVSLSSSSLPQLPFALLPTVGSFFDGTLSG